MANTPPTSVRLKPETKIALKRYADDNDRSESWIMEKALTEFLVARQYLEQPI